MKDVEFLDTNILVYAYDADNATKRRTAQELLRQALTGQMVISPQVLAEFCATLLHKMTPPAAPESLAALLDALVRIRAVAADSVRRAVEARARYGVPFYDGMIIASAERGRRARLLSEDLNEGQEYFGVVVKNPFR